VIKLHYIRAFATKCFEADQHCERLQHGACASGALSGLGELLLSASHSITLHKPVRLVRRRKLVGLLRGG
jgi:hypothetical protein